MSIEELKRRQGVYEAILAGMPADSPDRQSYENDLNRIKAEIASAEQPAEDVQKDAPEEAVTAPLPEKVEPVVQQTEELVLPAREETAPVTKENPEVKEPETAPAGATLAQVPTKALFGELVNRIVEHLKKA